MVYKRVTAEERSQIYRWWKEGRTQREIARRLDRNVGSISRELARNTGRRGYRPKQAHNKAQTAAKRAGPRRFTEPVRIDAEARLKEGWTPEIIGQRARHEGRAWVCKDTIYKYVYADAKAGGGLWKNLPRAKRKRQRRCPRQDGRGRGQIPNQRMIGTRPAEVETRKTIGHWEGDLINGAHGTGNLATLVERSCRFTLVGRTNSKEADEVNRKICSLFAPLPRKALLSTTFDNGKEVRPAPGACQGHRHGCVFRQSLPLVGAWHQREHERPDSSALSQEVVVLGDRRERTQAHRRVSQRPSAQVFGLVDAAGEDGRIPWLRPVK